MSNTLTVQLNQKEADHLMKFRIKNECDQLKRLDCGSTIYKDRYDQIKNGNFYLPREVHKCKTGWRVIVQAFYFSRGDENIYVNHFQNIKKAADKANILGWELKNTGYEDCGGGQVYLEKFFERIV